MAGSSSFLNLTLKELNKAYRSKTVTVAQVLTEVLSHQRKLSDLNAFVSLTSAPRLKEKCEQSQKRHWAGCPLSPLDGVPVAVKDNLCTDWAATSCASRLLQHYTPPYTATVVQRLEDLGAIVIGKTNMDEFGMGSSSSSGAAGPVRNVLRSGVPYSLGDLPSGPMGGGRQLSPGGSSGGSAVAVAAGLVWCALGTDTGGSTRQPAAACGVVGLRPSSGALSRHGLAAHCNTTDTVALLARCCHAAAAAATLLYQRDGGRDSTSTAAPNRAPSTPLSGLVLGLPVEYNTPNTSPEVVRCWQDAAALLETLGATTTPTSLPHTPLAPACYTVLNTCDVASNFSRFSGSFWGGKVEAGGSMEAQYRSTRTDLLGEEVKLRILAGNHFLQTEDYPKAAAVRRLIRDDFTEAFRTCSLLLTPTLPRPPTPAAEDGHALDVHTLPASLAALPALSLPAAYTREGLPLSLQLIGPPGSDFLLLRVGEALEEALALPRPLF